MSRTSAERFRIVSELFEQAMAVPPSRRLEFVRDRGVDPAVVAEVTSLLKAASEDDGFLESPPAEVERLRTQHGRAWPIAAGLASGLAGASDPLVGRRVSSFTVVARIASGGMGVLYEAQQENPRRTVAIKVIRPDMMSPETLARFRREADLLGRLQHPGIAAVFEAGSFQHPDDPAGLERPYCVLELIDGRPITEWAERRRLDVPASLTLLASVCDAVDHAHARGVIHRDLKPSNILVTADGQPKVVDFGIARAIEPGSGDTLRTGVGDIVGTLGYMSPEQLGGRSGEIDARADVYSLGVLAYELLAGRPPYDLRGLSLTDSMRRLAVENPTRLGSMRRELRGDVEVVVSKAMARDAAIRYPTAAALARDLRRIVENQPVSAKPPSQAYRLRKFIGRHRAASVASGLAAVLLVVAALGTGIGWHRARQEGDRAVRYNEILKAIMDSFDPAQIGRSDVSMEQAVDVAAKRLDDASPGLPEAASELHVMLGERYALLGAHGKAAQQFEAALEAWDASGQSDPLERAELLAMLGSALTESGKPLDGLARHEEALRLRAAELPASDLRLAESLHNLSVAHRANGNLPQALRSVREAIAIVKSNRGGRGHEAELSWSLAQLGTVLMDLGDLDAAVEATNEAVALREQIQPDDLAKAKLLHRFASVLKHDPSSRETAERMLRDSLAIRRRFLPEDHADLQESRCALARVLLDGHRFSEALALAEEALSSAHAAALAEDQSIEASDSHAAIVADANGIAAACRERLPPEP